MKTISAVIIAKNEEQRIEPTLQSLHWVDEIIILDSGSNDRTVEICRRYTPHVFETGWPGFGIQKNRAIEKASGNWILSIDADEIIPEPLREEILEAIQKGDFDGFELPRLSSYCGQPMHHSGWWPDYVPRLFRKDQGKFTETAIHERLEIKGTTKRLQNPLHHNSFENLEQVLEKVNHYSTIAATQLYEQGKRSSLSKALLKGAWAFLRTYLFKAGFLDNNKGLMLAISNAEGTYYKYLKLALLHEQHEQHQPPQD